MPAARRYVAKLTAFAASCVVALLLAEGAVRVFSPHTRDHVLPDRLFDFDAAVGWTLKPHRRVTHESQYFSVEYRTNADGVRDRDRDPARGAGAHRVLLYGDSQVFGWGVAEAERFSNLLEARVASLDLWNRAIPAYGLDQEVLAYQRDGGIQTDEVIFFVSEETLRRTTRGYMDGRYKPMFVAGADGSLAVVPPRQVAFQRMLYELFSPLYLPHFVNRRLRMLTAVSAAEASAEADLGAQIVAFARTIARERAHKVRILADLPQPDRDAWRARCRELGIAFVALEVDDGTGPVALGADDPHWNTRAHRRVADQLLAQVDWPAPMPR